MKTEFFNQNNKLITKLQRGNSKAQFKVYELYYKAMYNTALRIVNDSAEAEDIMQEAFLAAFSKIKTYKGEVSFGAWLKRIVINKSLDFLKKRKLEFSEIDEKTFAPSDKISFSEGKDVLKQVEQVKEAISQLAAGYRVVLSLYLLEGYDHNEISEILNITPSASRSQFTRARKKLLELMILNSYQNG